MSDFFRSLRIDRLSFWVGFVTALLLWWFIVKLWPYLFTLGQKTWAQVKSAQRGLQASIQQRHRADTLKHIQGLHLAAPLFALDEIIVPPRLLAPPAPVQPGTEPFSPEIASVIIPFMPDQPEFASVFGAHTLTPEEALSGGANIAIVGPPGSGKTTTLAYLAAKAARNQFDTPLLEDLLPIYIHAADLTLPLQEETEFIAPVVNAVGRYSSALSQARLPGLLHSALSTGHALVLLDGLDELAPDALKTVTDYIQQLLREFPQTRAVAAASPHYTGDLPRLGFAILPMAVWDTHQQAQFISQWGEMWRRFIHAEMRADYTPVEPLLLNGWLLNRHAAITPFNFTLQVWAAYAGDARGATQSDAIEAYLRRMTVSIPKARPALERCAIHALRSMRSAFTEAEAQIWVSEILPEPGVDEAVPSEVSTHQENPGSRQITIPRVLPDLSRRGILVPRSGERLGFVHPLIAGYAAGQALAQTNAKEIFNQPDWSFKATALHYLVSRRDIAPYFNRLISQRDDPLHRGLVQVSEWLQDIPLYEPWRRNILAHLSKMLSSEDVPFATKVRILSRLAVTKDPDTSALFRHLLKSPQLSVRKLAALGCGYQRDTQAVEAILPLLHDHLDAGQAACLALVNIGTQPALEAVASAMLQGSEEIRRAAAEAFALHPQEGHPTLREAVTLDDLLVRRAAIHGLRLIRQPWAIQLLEEIQIEDAQWVVKNAAAQAYEELQAPDVRIPQPLMALSEIPWLISFAGERGVGISPGDPARRMLLRALQEGSTDERLAAMYIIGRSGFASIFPAIYDSFFNDDPELHQAAFDTLWQIANTGAEILPPGQFGRW